MGFPGDDEVLDVHPSMSPKGVEHKNVRGLGVVEASVHPSMSPKGVEHIEFHAISVIVGACIHQCRRKALSTRSASGSPARPQRCIHQCRRKALSTCSGSTSTAREPWCIHQCRRKALSTLPGCRYAGPRGQPEGTNESPRLDHRALGQDRTVLRGVRERPDHRVCRTQASGRPWAEESLLPSDPRARPASSRPSSSSTT